MESFESILESEWSALNAMYSTEESGFMAQLLNYYCSIPNDLHSGSNLTLSSNKINVDHVLLVFCNVGAKEENKSFGQLLSNSDMHKNMVMELEQEDQVLEPQLREEDKRRERINERLRTLQNLVPNGTKVDISTMLEDDVEYVKFLQLQIKLLSSDDKWIYAPIAYNGTDVRT
ncbi:hypothetical protein AgCh_022708 [Apium graveolens]